MFTAIACLAPVIAANSFSKAVISGPARSDLQNWNYETVDIAPYLNAGKNTLAAVVTYMAEYAPFAQMHYQFGFIVQGDGDTEQVVNTNNTWKIFQNPAYSPVINDIPKLRTYIVMGAGDRVEAAKYPWGWEEPAFDDAAWTPAKPIGWPAKPRGLGTDGNWNLVARTIPFMEEIPQRLATVRRSEGVDVDDDFLQGKNAFTVHRNSKTVILCDQGH
ncbi:MAG: alpha-L-rhamnosidase, partial [Verrucomicrobiaceae bacterium]